MASGAHQPPDLASVLRTLAAYSQPPLPYASQARFPQAPLPQASQVAQTTYDLLTTDGPAGYELEEGEYDPNEAYPVSTAPPLTATPPRPPTIPPPQLPVVSPFSQQPTSDTRQPISRHVQHSVEPPSAPQHPFHLPSSQIRTWPPALRHVTRLLTLNPHLTHRIRKLIIMQHQHEQQWFTGRKALIQQQLNRTAGRAKVQEVLRAIGSTTTEGGQATSGTVSTPDDDAAELRRYDAKVHRACGEMVKGTLGEFRGMGIPFFGTDIGGGSNEKGGGLDSDGGRGEEMKALQRRMVQLLEELCQE